MHFHNGHSALSPNSFCVSEVSAACTVEGSNSGHVCTSLFDLVEPPGVVVTVQLTGFCSGSYSVNDKDATLPEDTQSSDDLYVVTA